MEGFRHVLAALDLGAGGHELTLGSRKAMSRAAWIARHVGVRLTLLHSGRPDEYWDAESKTFVSANGDDSKSGRALEQAMADLGSDALELRLVISEETAWMAVVREVLREAVDVVVASKRTNLHSDDRKLGTVAHKLVRNCPCPVWLEDVRATRDPSVILAATDLTAVGDRAVLLAASVADALGAKLHVVHAFSLSMEVQLEREGVRQEHIVRTRAAAQEHIEGLLAATPMAGHAKLHIGLTSPTQAVLEGVEVLRPGLVVMGTVGRGGIPGLLIGNTAERLIDRIDCALLTIKPEDFVCPVAVERVG
jgi:universal stress protein E